MAAPRRPGRSVVKDLATSTIVRSGVAPKDKLPEQPLAERLKQEPFVFRFFQAVRLLEQFLPRRMPVGRFVPPKTEVARFGATASVSFPASDIHALEFPENAPPQMTVNFMGLTGPHGVLPLPYSVEVIERKRAGDLTLQAWMDMFNHRAISLLFRAWEKYRFAISYERGERSGVTQSLMDVIGVGTDGLPERQKVPDDSLLFYAGLLGQHPHSAKSLEQILSDYFDVPVEIEQFLGAWNRLDTDSICVMDERPTPSEQVGGGAVVGDEVWDPHARVRVKLGPLPMERYLEFLPNGDAFEPLRAITRFYSNDEFSFEVQLILQQHEVPACTLGAEGDATPQLGWVTWMRSVPMDRNPQDTILPL